MEVVLHDASNLHLSVNRINIMSKWAVRGLGSNWQEWDVSTSASRNRSSLSATIIPRLNYWYFKFQLSLISLSFRLTRAWQQIGALFGWRWMGFEDVLDKRMAETMYNKLGIVVTEETFNA